ncbi:hypothetical protein INT48_001984 [Thamnidium elegans]|uniref:DUF8032 domain-containing protein n=1 Tax=Thamnidium elegans TaxID=101142 RepID=A0A8H7VXH1_9FUNG|nr:hypothetical protein INT48_001984 [Thamnidium elegans]
MSQPNLHLQLCVNDLLHPTEKSESLLEALTSTQLEEIEKTLHKIKEKKQSSSTQQLVSPIPITQTANPSALHHDWALVAAQIAKALADTITTATTSTIKTEPEHAKPPNQSCAGISSDKSTHIASVAANKSPTLTTTPTSSNNNNNNSTPTTPNAAAAGSVVPNHEPRTEVREGVEWVSFVYSHHRVLRRYSIRTDVEQVDINLLDDKFKGENCVYPRANLPRDQYKGNRWAYETECNTLGWKLAYLNSGEIAGKRGLIQRAVDSYRNRYPSMRSRRVARQEKLMKGTLRKRKHRESEENSSEAEDVIIKNIKKEDTKLDARSLLVTSDLPKTVSIDDGLGGTKYRIRINVDSVSLDSIDLAFRRANCVYPRAMDINTSSPFASQRQLEEAKCNELGWKLAWLNPKQLANRKNLLQRVLDVYRSKFLPDLNPRKNSLRMPSSTQISMDTDDKSATTLTVAALAAQEQDITATKVVRRGSAENHDDNESLYSGTTDSLDFHDCFSPPSEQVTSSIDTPMKSSSPTNIYELTLSVPTSSDELLSGTPHPLFESGHESCRRSISSSSSSGSDLSSPSLTQDHLDDTLFKDSNMFGLYTEHIQLPSAGVVFEHCDYIKTEDENLMIDPLMSQLFHI